MKKKFQSRRFWIVLWAIAYVSIISFYVIKESYDAVWVAGTLALAIGIVITWMGFSSAKKKAGE